MGYRLRIALLAVLGPCACTAAPNAGGPYSAPPLDDSGFDTGQKADVNGVTWRRWETPLPLQIDEPTEGSVAYQHCTVGDPSTDTRDDGTIDVTVDVRCVPPSAEIAWYIVPAETVQPYLDGGYASLSIRIGVTGPVDGARLRTAIHRTDAGAWDTLGRDTKLASHPMLFDGDTLSAPLEGPGDYHVFVARGRSLYPFWGTDRVSYSLGAAFSYEAPADPPPIPMVDAAAGTW